MRYGQAGNGYNRLQPAEAHRLAYVPARLPTEAHRQIEGTAITGLNRRRDLGIENLNRLIFRELEGER